MGDTATPRELRMPLDQSSQDSTRVKLDSVIQDIISDHGLDRPQTESAGDFARNVGSRHVAALLCQYLYK